MKLPVPGFVSQALSSLINNDRRSKRAPFEDACEMKVEETKYDFPEVSEERRQELVEAILKKRKKRLFWGKLVLVGGLIAFLLLMFVSIAFMAFTPMD